MRRVVLCVGLFVVGSGSAWAVNRYDYLFTSNRVGGDGRRLVIRESGTAAPCWDDDAYNAAANIWWTLDGVSLGIAENRTYSSTYPYVYASVSEYDGNNGCNVTNNWCGGAARVTASSTSASPPIAHSWVSVINAVNEPAIPDVAAVKSATLDAVVTLDKKTGGGIDQRAWGSGTYISHTSLDHLSQVRWVTDLLWVATETATYASGGTTYPDIGRVILGKRNQTGTLSVDVTDLATGTEYSKPEGITSFTLDGLPDSCHANADYIVYTADYEYSRLYAYYIDIDGTLSINPQPLGGGTENSISLDTDSTSANSAFSGECNPSSVEYHSYSGNLFVLCQTRDSIIRLDLTDPCDPTWEVAEDDEARLEYYTTSTSPPPDPSCDNEVTTTACPGGGGCDPHNIDYDYSIEAGPDWLFVALSAKGQISAVNATTLTDQRVIYATNPSGYKPQDLAVVPSCNPQDPNCTYPAM